MAKKKVVAIARGDKLPKLDAEYLLIETYDMLESGNAKAALETLESELKEVATKNPAEYFRLLADAAYDRPGAWWAYATLLKLPKRLCDLELAMHASNEPKEVRAKIRAHFDAHATRARGNEAFKILFSPGWDT
jgi:hypothetical protein